MNKKSIFLVCLTTVIFALALFFIPKNMTTHIDGLGQITRVSNKYKTFISFIAVDIVGSIFWNIMVDNFNSLKFLPVVQDKLKTFFSVLMFFLLLSLLTAPISSILALCILFGGNVIYIVYMIYLVFKKK